MYTEYQITYKGHSWPTTDTEIAQQYAQRGATINAQTMHEADTPGIPVQRLSQDELNRLAEIADESDWAHVQHMVRQFEQRGISNDQ